MKHVITQEEAGRRIDQLLGTIEQVGSRSHAERLVRDGLVTVNGRTVAKSYRVQAADELEIDDAAIAAPVPVQYAGTELDIAYEDDDVLVVNKPAGMVVHPAPGYREPTLVEILAAGGVVLAPSEDAKLMRPGVVHRLDKDTSGLIMLAKHSAALRSLQQSIQNRTARREYIALVAGHVPSRAGRVEAPIGRDVRDAAKRSIDTDAPQDAITHFVVQEILPTTTLLRLRLETGRTHQIRVHMQAIGHPVVGDHTYGHGTAFGLHRQFLHAARLTFPHPVTENPVEVTSPLPDELLAALAEARRAEEGSGG
jgi:23S rRNA pseudouridine1911/1915/1917 synthase